METNKLIEKIVENRKDAAEFLKDNSLLHICENINKDVECEKFQNRINFLYNKKIINEIDILLTENNIKYISFKGLCLAKLLYDDCGERKVGDIDIYVDYIAHNKTIKLLKQKGFRLEDDNQKDYSHHICLTNGKALIELHRNILNPFTQIEESYLHNNVTSIDINGRQIRTFTITATFLHLLYHLYMDTCLACGSLYFLFVNQCIPKADRFLYRSYEIALFSEKYFNEINWYDIEKDLRSQHFKILFKIMIYDIIKIFPNVFPKSFIDTLCNLNYFVNDTEQLYKFKAKINNKADIHDCLSKYINENWKARRNKNMIKRSGGKISLIKESVDNPNETLSCDVTIKKTVEGLRMDFMVSNNDFFISNIDNYDTQASDGVHLLLCGTEKFSYNSIFFFPKKIDGKIKVVPCDVLNDANKVLNDDFVTTQFQKTDSDYTITAIFSNKFIEKHHLNSYFYMGMVISDCSSETQYRKNQLILSEEDSQWYNPIYFAKIYI